MGMGPCVLASGSNQVLASISVIKKGTSLHPSHEPVLTSTRVPSSSLFHQKVGRAKISDALKNDYKDIDNLPAGSLKYCQMCDITAEMPDTMDGILYQARNFRLSSGTGAAYLVQLLKHLPISIEVCNANLTLTMSPLDRARMYLEDMVAVLNAAGEH